LGKKQEELPNLIRISKKSIGITAIEVKEEKFSSSADDIVNKDR
jgi:hypothetical protein